MELAITAGGFLLLLISSLAAFWFRIEGTFVRKDVNAMAAKGIEEALARLEATAKETHAVVTKEMGSAIQKACLDGVAAGVTLERKRMIGAKRLLSGDRDGVEQV